MESGRREMTARFALKNKDLSLCPYQQATTKASETFPRRMISKHSSCLQPIVAYLIDTNERGVTIKGTTLTQEEGEEGMSNYEPGCHCERNEYVHERKIIIHGLLRH